MVKSELIEMILRRIAPLIPPGVKKKDLEIAINTVFKSMEEALISRDKIEIRGFGSFKVKEKRARVAKNPRTGSKINLSERKYLLFRAGKELKRIINEKE